MAPFRFGVQLSGASSGASWRDLSRSIEGLGYSTLFIPDHFEDQFGPLVALTVAAEATTTLKVGSLVFGNDYRHPIVLAKEIATLDLLSEGRVEFGLGAGWMTTDYEQSGIANDPPGVRISRMAESLAIMKSLWSTGAATFAGEHYTINGAVGRPMPHSRPYPKVIIGGGGRRVLGMAAREADIVGVNPSLAAGYVGSEVLETTTAEYYDQRITWIREAAGDRFADLELQVLTFLVQIVPDREDAIERLSSMMGVTPEQIDGSPIALIGTIEQIT
ncbi:MAG TPA: TIGR03621 family F420-dependent LLM class oxidoreductase, partial [Acidimicrobiales bacterium]